jgi:hypothetical protein
MMAHGALNTNYGRKKIIGPARHQQRAREQREPSLEAAQKRVDKKGEARKAQQAKVAASTSKGHSTRLAQRQRALVRVEQAWKDAQDKRDHLAEHASALGPPRERADRDFRTQTLMTVRTLLLENALMSFMAVLFGTPNLHVRLDGLLHILFERSGARMETASQVVYWVNTAGGSVPYRRLLTEVVTGLGAMDVRDQGKPMCVRLKDMPP